MRTARDAIDPRAAAAASIDSELFSIEAAIDLVASGQARRVSLGGLRLADRLVDRVRRRALLRGIRILEVWPLGDGSPDLVVERVATEGAGAGDA